MMAYVDGFVIAVPTANKDKFIAHANLGNGVFLDLGATRILENWGDDVPTGKATDFYRAVAAEDGETVCFSWIEWPDKATRDAAFAKMTEWMEHPETGDPRMDPAKNPMPFDGKRMIFGGFTTIVDERAGGDAGYVDGFVCPVSPDKREAYVAMAQKAAGKFLEAGALRDCESWGDDVPEGKVTDFRRSVLAEGDESVVFSWVEWPDKATRDAGWGKIMADDSMKPDEMPFDGKRMFWGGFRPVVNLGE